MGKLIRGPQLGSLAGVIALLAASSSPVQSGCGWSQGPREGRTVAEILARIGEAADVVVLADSTVRNERITPPTRPATANNVEEQVKSVVRALPPSTTWAKLYLPAPSRGRWNGDAVSELASAQARHLGRKIGVPAPPGTVEILGQPIPEENGKELIAALHLKLVYLVTNPGARPAMFDPTQLDQFGRMDMADKFQFIQQLDQQIEPQLEGMRMLFGQMTDDERVQFKMMMSSDDERARFYIMVNTGPFGPKGKP
jgi:hypothetical protein